MADPFELVCMWKILFGRPWTLRTSKWRHVIDLRLVILSYWFVWDYVGLVQFVLKAEGRRTFRSQFKPSGRALHCFWKLGTLPFYFFFFDKNVAFFFTLKYSALKFKIVYVWSQCWNWCWILKWVLAHHFFFLLIHCCLLVGKNRRILVVSTDSALHKEC